MQKSSEEAGAIDLAMNQVLAAERDARQAVEACRADAKRILDETEERTRRIARRTERRIKAAHGVADAAVERALRSLAEGPGEPAAGIAGDGDRERLERALDRLVDEMLDTSP
jgi:hypothetical protein